MHIFCFLVYIYACGGNTCICVYVYESLILISHVLFSSSLPYLLSQSLLLNLKLTVLCGWTGWLWSFEDAPGSASLMLRLQAYTIMSFFFNVSARSKPMSSLHSIMSLTDNLPTPCVVIIFGYRLCRKKSMT